ncbi:MAG: ATPase [Actinobacteria bacterium]|nr:MAG: ATPase [Actinomycetota bacterium]
MPTDVRVARTGELVTVVLTGMLTLEGVPRVRGILLKCLADCPTGLIVDVSGLHVDSDLPLVVFPTVARQARSWPGAPPVLLCAPSGPVADRFARWNLGRMLPVHEDWASAVAALDEPEPGPPALRADLPFGPDAQRQARRLVSTACLEWGLPQLCMAAELIASELTGNAVRHGAPPLRLVAAARTRYLHIVARDGSPRPPRPVDPPPVPYALASGGYGLRLVDAVAATWGFVRTAGGKAVWATLRREGVGWPRLLRTARLLRTT